MSNALLAIQNQVNPSRPNDVFVVEVLSVRFPSFTVEIQQELERYQSLQMLTFNSCGISSLSHFPSIPSLIRLDLVMNEITGPELVHLGGCRHLQTIMLGGNQIASTGDLAAFKGMRQLFQINLLSNPIQSESGYRSTVFAMFPSLTVLDGLDKGGKDAFNATSMANTTARVPTGLFDTSRPAPAPDLFGTGSSLAPSPPPFGSLFGTGAPSLFPPSVPPPRKGRKRSVSPSPPIRKSKSPEPKRKAIIVRTGKSRVTATTSSSTRAGITFPVGRIKRHLKQNDPHNRVTKGSAVFLAAVLEYLSCEVLEIAGNVAKREKRARITPRMINEVFQTDEDFNRSLRDSILIPR